MNTKHTPGPWNSASLDQDSDHIEVFAGVSDGEQVAVVKGHDLSTGKYYEAIANARLIAAAPELLDLVRRMGAHIADQCGDGLIHTLADEARTLIAKATNPSADL